MQRQYPYTTHFCDLENIPHTRTVPILHHLIFPFGLCTEVLRFCAVQRRKTVKLVTLREGCLMKPGIKFYCLTQTRAKEKSPTRSLCISTSRITSDIFFFQLASQTAPFLTNSRTPEYIEPTPVFALFYVSAITTL